MTWGTGTCMFNRKHHQNIIRVLDKLDADVLERAGCFFGGGTAIVLATNEYRESVDIDFLVGTTEGYRQIRELVSDKDINKLAKEPIPLLRDVRKDRDKISAVLNAGEGERPIKLEIVLEGRIPLSGQRIAGIPVATLSRVDLYAEKMLANADRWNDASVMYRDAIDIAMMIDHWGQIPSEAIEKTRPIYGDAVTTDLRKVTQFLSSNESALNRALASMAMDPELAPRITALLQAEVRRIEGKPLSQETGLPDDITRELDARGLVSQRLNVDRGLYTGSVLLVSGRHAVQDIGRKTVAVHQLADGEARPTVGGQYRVQYHYGHADWEPKNRSGKELGR